MIEAMQNTDAHLWPIASEDADAPSIHVTATGGIGINVGGCVIVMSLRDWHALALRDVVSPVPPSEPVGWQKRYKQSNGDWTSWREIDRELFESYVSSWGGLSSGTGANAAEVRPLYAHPSSFLPPQEMRP